MSTQGDLRARLETVAEEFRDTFAARELRPGVDYLPPSGKVVGVEEFKNLLNAATDMWLTTGRFADEFETKFPTYWGMKKSLLVNSGSSANLLATATLTSPKLRQRALRPGDEMITAGCGFPTTVAPGVQMGLKPVFVDIDIETHNATVDTILAAVTPKTKLIMLAHALGNPFRADLLADFCEKNGIWLIEDCCDALGARIGNASVGTFGDLATCSFYPAHHITMGEGGAVLTNDPILAKLALSFRDWGRDCWCPPAASDTCGIRFNWKLGDLPKGYDHKYIYSHLGYNLKSTDFQAAVGLAQLDRLEMFIRLRRENHAYLDSRLKDLGLENDFILPKATPGTEPSWFGYFMHLRDANAERRLKVIKYLEEKKVGTRLLFGGNLTKQPAFQNVDYRIHGSLENSDAIMNGGFWVGIWPGLKNVHLDYMAETLAAAARL